MGLLAFFKIKNVFSNNQISHQELKNIDQTNKLSTSILSLQLGLPKRFWDKNAKRFTQKGLSPLLPEIDEMIKMFSNQRTKNRQYP